MSDREAHGDCSLFEEFVAVGRNIYKGGKKAKIPLLSGLQSQGRSLLTECARMLTASSCCPSPIDQSGRLEKLERGLSLIMCTWKNGSGLWSAVRHADLGALTSSSLLSKHGKQGPEGHGQFSLEGSGSELSHN